MLNGFSPPKTNWTIKATVSACDIADTFIAEAGVGKPECLMILCVGAMHVERQWPPTYFARLIEKISIRFPRLNFGLMGTSAELPLIKAMIAWMSDSSLLNIAAACGKLAIDLFAQTLLLIYNLKIKSVAVSSDQVGKQGAIKTIALDLVFDAV